MPSNPPTVADLEADVAEDCGIALAEAGLYLRAVDVGGLPMTPVIRKGLRNGAAKVGLFLSNPLALTDADVANLSPFAIHWIEGRATIFALQQALQHWHRAVQKDQDRLAATPMTGGWLNEEKRMVRDRVSELKAEYPEPYREPTDPIVVSNVGPYPFGRVSTNAMTPIEPGCGPYGYGPFGPYGYGWDGYGYGYGCW